MAIDKNRFYNVPNYKKIISHTVIVYCENDNLIYRMVYKKNEINQYFQKIHKG